MRPAGNWSGVFPRYSDALARPSIVRLDVNMYIAQFYVMKLVPAKHIIEFALRDGTIDGSATVVDTTSGTFGLGMGITCAELGLRFKIFSDPVIDSHFKRRLELLGGDVVIVTGGGDVSPQQARLAALHKYLAANPKAYWLRQYDNPRVLESYAATADDIRNACRRPTKLIATVGSGGSSCGIAARLRMFDTTVKLIGVDTFGSVLFGLENAARNVRGMGNSILPGNLNHRAFDEVHWIDGGLATRGAQRLLTAAGIFAGPSTGAAYLVARWLSAGDPGSDVVFIAPDAGYRYQDQLLGSAQERSNVMRLAECPRMAEAPYDVKKPWACMAWGRRTLAEAKRI